MKPLIFWNDRLWRLLVVGVIVDLAMIVMSMLEMRLMSNAALLLLSIIYYVVTGVIFILKEKSLGGWTKIFWLLILVNLHFLGLLAFAIWKNHDSSIKMAFNLNRVC